MSQMKIITINKSVYLLYIYCLYIQYMSNIYDGGKYITFPFVRVG